ncbi:hypothetical protein JOE54_000251 [Brachybacterium tyrofermentans]
MTPGVRGALGVRSLTVGVWRLVVDARHQTSDVHAVDGARDVGLLRYGWRVRYAPAAPGPVNQEYS